MLSTISSSFTVSKVITRVMVEVLWVEVVSQRLGVVGVYDWPWSSGPLLRRGRRPSGRPPSSIAIVIAWPRRFTRTSARTENKHVVWKNKFKYAHASYQMERQRCSISGNTKQCIFGYVHVTDERRKNCFCPLIFFNTNLNVNNKILI